MWRKALMVFLMCSCAHVPRARFADDSGAAKTMWLCREDPKSAGDLECIDFRRMLIGRESVPDSEHTTEM